MTESALAAALRLTPAELVDRATAPIDVAVLDSGIDATHPDLLGRVVRAATIEHGVVRDEIATGANDVLGHGTAVAGIIARIAPNARLHDVRILRSDSLGVGDDLLAGMRLAVDSGWRVINLSLAAPGRLAPELARFTERAFYQDQIIVAARRNFPISDEGLPAEFASCIGVDVGAALLTPQFRYRDGYTIEVEAPGEEVPGTSPWRGLHDNDGHELCNTRDQRAVRSPAWIVPEAARDRDTCYFGELGDGGRRARERGDVAMTDKFEVRRGRKIEGEDTASALRSGRYTLMLARPNPDMVEAQGAYSGWTQCPHCGHVGWTVGLGVSGTQSVICGACGQPFTV